MALVSPGVEVTVTDESAYPASGPGTIPLIFIATAQDKLVPGSTSTVAKGTLKENANKPYLLTSQSDALNFFGSPVFQEYNGSVLQGDELNEWGLHGLYSVLGVTNQAWAMRADIDLHELQPTKVEPRNFAKNQTVWLDADASKWGLHRHDGFTWRPLDVMVPKLTEVQTKQAITQIDQLVFSNVTDAGVYRFSIDGQELDVTVTKGMTAIAFADAFRSKATTAGFTVTGAGTSSCNITHKTIGNAEAISVSHPTVPQASVQISVPGVNAVKQIDSFTFADNGGTAGNITITIDGVELEVTVLANEGAASIASKFQGIANGTQSAYGVTVNGSGSASITHLTAGVKAVSVATVQPGVSQLAVAPFASTMGVDEVAQKEIALFLQDIPADVTDVYNCSIEGTEFTVTNDGSGATIGEIATAFKDAANKAGFTNGVVDGGTVTITHADGTFYPVSPMKVESAVFLDVFVSTIVIGIDGATDVPKDSFGVPSTDDLYAVVPYINNGSESKGVNHSTHQYWKKAIGSPSWENVTDEITFQRMDRPEGVAGKLWVKLDTPNNGVNLHVSTFQQSTLSWSNNTVHSGKNFIEIEAAYGALLGVNSLGFLANTGTHKNIIYRKKSTAIAAKELTYTLGNIATSTFKLAATDGALPFIQEFDLGSVSTPVELVNKLSAAGSKCGLVFALDTSKSTITGTSSKGTSFAIVETATASPFFTDGKARATEWIMIEGDWVELNHFASLEEPTQVAKEGSLWFDDSLYGDMMISDGQKWVGFQSVAGQALLNSSTVTWQFSQVQPNLKPDLVTPLENNDIWIDPNDGANLQFYRYHNSSWVLLDDQDQTTTDGLLFADLRQTDENGDGYLNCETDVAKKAFLASDYVDPDAPDPRLYPRGMFALNTRATGGIVRKLVLDPFVDELDPGETTYRVGNSQTFTLAKAVTDADVRARWVTESGNNLDGSGLFGREAQRKVVVEALAESILNDEIRSEFIDFNLIVAPGYVELLDELVTLNTDRKETSYIITDVPARLEPTGTKISNWAKNANNAPSNGDVGRTTAYPYSAQYMGWCLGTNVDGSEVTIPGSSVALRTYVYSDSVSYVWFPPAGAQRGIVTNAASVGYINSENEYTPVVYNQGQRDVMYQNNINPITMRPNRGLLVWGDKSLSPTASALDRVNVGRLIVHLRTEIAKIADRFIFQLNTARVREEFAGALNAFLANIVQLEGLYDYVVICDTSNNTPARIDRNEMWADIAIQPTKSVNFIYCPIRIQNSQ